MATTTFFENMPVRVGRTVLDNGLTVLTAETGSRFVTCKVLVATGALNDNPDRPGAAHFLEHVTCRGRGDGEHPLLASLWEQGIQFNAKTTEEWTEYHLVGLSDRAPSLVSLLLEAALRTEIMPATVETERDIILAEYRRQKKGFEKARERLELLFAPGSPWRHAVSLGTETGIQAIDVDHLRARAERDYFPENMTLILTGGITHEQAVVYASNGDIPSSGRSRLVQAHAGDVNIVDVTRNEPSKNDSAHVECYWPFPDSDRFRHPIADVAALLTNPHVGAVHRALRNERRTTYAVSHGIDARQRTLHVRADLPPDQVALLATETQRALSAFASDIPDAAWNYLRLVERIDEAARDDSFRGPNSYGSWAGFLHRAWLEGDYRLGPDPSEPPLIKEQVMCLAKTLADGPHGQIVFKAS